MNLFVVVTAALFLTCTAVVAVPEVEAAPPDLPPNHTGCNYFHYHNGNLLQGTPPSYHYHHCI